MPVSPRWPAPSGFLVFNKAVSVFMEIKNVNVITCKPEGTTGVVPDTCPPADAIVTTSLKSTSDILNWNELPSAAFANILGIPTLQIGVFGGIIIGALAAWCYNKWFRIELPPFLGFFAGKRFVPIATATFALLPGWSPASPGRPSARRSTPSPTRSRASARSACSSSASSSAR